MLFLLLWLAIEGLVVGALGRLLVPGPNPMGLIRTALIGLSGAFLGGLVSRYVIGIHYRYSLIIGFVLAVIFAALIVALFDRRTMQRMRRMRR